MTKIKAKKEARVRLQPFVSLELARRLTAYCGARGVSETATIQNALRQFLDGTSDMTLLLKRLDRLGRDLLRSHRDVELHTEAFAVWLKIWFAHTPSIPEDAKRAARASGEARYKQFAEHVAGQFSAGKRFLDDLPREPIADEAELRALTESDPSPTAP